MTRTQIGTTPITGRPVWRLVFDTFNVEESPALRKLDCGEPERALIREALGVGTTLDEKRVTLGELVEPLSVCPAGSACARYLDSAGRVVLHVVGALPTLGESPASLASAGEEAPSRIFGLPSDSTALAGLVDALAKAQLALEAAKQDAARYLAERDALSVQLEELREQLTRAHDWPAPNDV